MRRENRSRQFHIAKYRKDLKMHPYKYKLVRELTPERKIARIEFCGWLLTHEDSFVQKDLRSDEKLWRLNAVSYRQNIRYWAAGNLCIEVQCKKIGGPKKV